MSLTTTVRMPLSAALVIAVALLLALPLVPAAAQSGDPELSCRPESAPAGTTVVCEALGVPASMRSTVELRGDSGVLAEGSAIAGTDGRASIDLAIPASVRPGVYVVGLAGRTVTFDLRVTAARPSGVSAGLSPSTGDVPRQFPVALAAAVIAALAGSVSAARRRAQAAPHGSPSVHHP